MSLLFQFTKIIHVYRQDTFLKYDDWLQSYDKNAKTLDRYEIFIINFKLVQNKKKREKNEENYIH
jgi:hypothetical protein